MSETLDALWQVIQDRKHHPRPGSYTASLFRKGETEIAKKVGEEAVEVIVAVQEGNDRIIYEAADLVYHLMVLLAARGLAWADVEAELRRRFRGHEKPHRREGV